MTDEAITRNLTVLGLVDLDGTREYGRSFPIDPAASLRTGARAGLSSTLAVVFAGLASYIGVVLLSLPPAIGVLQIIVFKLAVEIPPIVSLAWDNAGSAGKTPPANRFLYDSAWTGLLISVLAMANYAFYFTRHNFEITSVAASSNAHRGAMATVLLSAALCQMANIVLQRNHGRVLSRYQLYNPLFILGLSSAVLALLIGTYATGPLVASDIWASLAAAALFASIRKLQAYADSHHTREHILELLKAD
jgi:magnesium-transporting ATPase (P-type)